jgi:hypothetical protein
MAIATLLQAKAEGKAKLKAEALQPAWSGTRPIFLATNLGGSFILVGVVIAAIIWAIGRGVRYVLAGS